MKVKTTLAFFVGIMMATFSFGQVILEENFNGGFPDSWTVQNANSSDGWVVGTASSSSSQSWQVQDNSSGLIVATNDDRCNCDKSSDYIILPTLDFTNLAGAVIAFDMFYGEGIYGGIQESATLEVSRDGGMNWEIAGPIAGVNGWTRVAYDLSNYADEPSVTIGIHYDDNGGWLFGMAIDNVLIDEPLALDAELAGLTSKDFGEVDLPFDIKGEVFNNGIMVIESLDVTVVIDGGNPSVETIENLNIQPFSSTELTLSSAWTPGQPGKYDIAVTLSGVNGQADADQDNNSASVEIEIFPLIVAPNIVDEYLSGAPVEFMTVGTQSDQLDKPTDLDFFPLLGKRELWVINERIENTGGSTVTYFDAGTDQQTSQRRVDGNAWHFMSLPTALSFGENGNWASSTGIQDANHSGGTFTGPTLWSSDPAIYAQPSGGNGSHLDMLHGSPYSMGITHETGNAYWVFDGWNQEIVRYDFVDDHGPGNADHSDAMVRRYREIQVARDGDVPSHMILDKENGTLYAVDNGNDRVLRIDINSGSVAGPIALINEQLAEHSRMGNVDWDVIIDAGLDRPCGIEFIENRLLVGDYATGEIIIYDVDNDFAELGRIDTGNPGLTGLRIGPEGNIWFTNRLMNTVTMALPGLVSGLTELAAGAVDVFPNPTSDQFYVKIQNRSLVNSYELKVFDVSGKMVQQLYSEDELKTVDVSTYPKGSYTVQITTDAGVKTEKLVVQ